MLQQRLERAAQHAREMKLSRCQDEGERIDVVPMLEVHRGDEAIALILLDPNQKTLLRDVTLSIIGFDADSVCLTTEGYNRLDKGDTNPVTGKPWAYGDYQDLAENHDGVAKGWVRECLTTYAANRAGDILLVNAAYRYDGYVPVFEEAQVAGNEPDHRLSGRFPRVLVNAMNKPSVSASYMQLFGTEDLPDRTKRDLSAGKVLSSLMESRIILMATEGDERYDELGQAAEADPEMLYALEPGVKPPPEVFMNREQRRAWQRQQRGNR